MRPVLGILLGDSCGVGPELVAKMCKQGDLYPYCNPVLIGDVRVFQRAATVVEYEPVVRVINCVEDADFSDVNSYNFLDQADVDPNIITIGELSEISGKAAGDALFTAMDLCKDGKLHGFTFAPLNKMALKLGGHAYESENKLFGEYLGVGDVTSEINVLGDLLTSRVTSHVPLRDVSKYLTPFSIARSIRLIHETLQVKGVESPRIGVAALNPHCGENGTCGKEEIEIISPAVELVKSEGIQAVGPISSDILFIRANRGEFDGVVTMYHDQGQIALKLKGFQYGVTFHGALPVAIATAAHGSAFDIAGEGIATTDAMVNAVKLTASVAQGLMEDQK